MTEMNLTHGHARAFPANVEETRTVEFVISSAARDRYNTRCNPQGWNLENFNKNGIVGYQHNVYGDMCSPPNPDDVIGQGRAWVEGDQLIGSITFEPADINPLAEKLFRKVLLGTIRATSVGFQPVGEGRWGEGDEARGMENETYYFAGQELLEFSLVNIPANPEALVRSVRDQSAHALMYLRRATGLSFADIEGMTVRTLIDTLDDKQRSVLTGAAGATTPDETEQTEVLESEVSEASEPAFSPADLRTLLRDTICSPEERMRKALREALT